MSVKSFGIIFAGALSLVAVNTVTAIAVNPVPATSVLKSSDTKHYSNNLVNKNVGKARSHRETNRKISNRAISSTAATSSPSGSLNVRGWEWSQISQTPTAQTAQNLSTFVNFGGTSVTVDATKLVDVSEIADPLKRQAADSAIRANLTEYFALAQTAGITEASVLVGTPTWTHTETHYIPNIVAKWVADFNSNAQPGALLIKNVEWDVEPWGTPEWINGDRAAKRSLSVLWLTLMREVVSKQGSATTSVAAPYWFDSNDRRAAPLVRFEGVLDSPISHLFRILNSRNGNTIALMAYRDYATGPGGSIAAVSQEFELSKQYNVGVWIGQDIAAPINGEPLVSTFYDNSVQDLKNSMNAIVEQYGKNQNFSGFAINHIGAPLLEQYSSSNAVNW